MTLTPIDFYTGDTWPADQGRELLQRERKAADLLLRHGPQRPATVLDVGCGDGTFLRRLDRLAGRPWSYHGTDFSPYCLELARALPYTFRQGNLEEGIPFGDDMFDVVYSGEVIEHLYNPDLLLEECGRVLKPGGLLVLTTPNFQTWYNRVLFAAGIIPIFYEASTRDASVGSGPLRRFKHGGVPVGHVRLFNRRALADLLNANGFSPLAWRGAVFSHLPRPLRALDRCFNPTPSLASNLVVAARTPS